jgi:hypothetical protein
VKALLGRPLPSRECFHGGSWSWFTGARACLQVGGVLIYVGLEGAGAYDFFVRGEFW